jgi:FixJ family two-component response regulator
MSFTTFLVDDDPGILKALARLVRTAGYESRCYSSSQEFLRDHDPSIPGCAILDLRMPELDGLELQQRLAAAGVERPIIFLTGDGNIPASVQAMKAGAVDFLTKPLRREVLLSALSRAEERDSKERQMRAERQSFEAKLARLTKREREVLGHVIAGHLNKQIAAALGTGEKTIKVHRGRMMAKVEVKSVAELVRLAERASIEAAVSPSHGRVGP